MGFESELTRNQKIFTLLGAMLGLLLAALDQTIVATAGPAIQRDLAVPASMYPWITTSYMVTSTVFVPIYGKLSDLFGRKTILLVGVVVFLAGSLLCGIATTTFALIAFRAIQGAGAASLFTSAFAIVADMFPPAERGKYQGIFGACFGLSSVVGPLLGGFLTDRLGWHWVFFVNLPVGAAAIFFISTRMPALRKHRPDRPVIDFWGGLLLSVSVVPFLLALSLGRSAFAGNEGGYPWGSAPIVGMFALAAAGAVAFVLVERMAKEPLLDLRLFQNKAFAIGNLAAFVVAGSFLASIVFLPLFMVNVIGLSATRSGLTITPLTMGIIAGNVAVGQLVSRIGRYRVLMLGSLTLLMAAFAVMAFTVTVRSTELELTLKMILVGLGLGPSIPLYTIAIQNAVPPKQMGVATSTVTFSRQMGSTVGVAVLGTVFAAVLTHAMSVHLGDPEGVKQAFALALSHIYRISIGVAALAFAVTLFLPELPLRRSN